MTYTQPVRDVRFHRIRITDTAIEECEGKLAVVSIPRSQIRSIRLVETVVSEHPGLMFVLGVVCAAAGVVGVLSVLGGVMRIGAAGITAALFSPMLIAASVRRGPVLIVETAKRTRKLGLGPRVAADELPGFVDLARGADCAVDVAVPTATLVRS